MTEINIRQVCQMIYIEFYYSILEEYLKTEVDKFILFYGVCETVNFKYYLRNVTGRSAIVDSC